MRKAIRKRFLGCLSPATLTTQEIAGVHVHIFTCIVRKNGSWDYRTYSRSYEYIWMGLLGAVTRYVSNEFAVGWRTSILSTLKLYRPQMQRSEQLTVRSVAIVGISARWAADHRTEFAAMFLWICATLFSLITSPPQSIAHELRCTQNVLAISLSRNWCIILPSTKQSGTCTCYHQQSVIS